MNMKSKYCILMVLAVILINCILYGCSEKNQNISELPDGISIKKSTIKGKENDEILVIKKIIKMCRGILKQIQILLK